MKKVRVRQTDIFLF